MDGRQINDHKSFVFLENKEDVPVWVNTILSELNSLRSDVSKIKES
jgi:hypothetical protein